MLHTTKGIVLRTVKYGDTSIITTIYTEIFGIQSYIVKGVRQSSKKSGGRAGFFQPSAILDMVVYHNDLKQLQFIKEYQWGYLYENLLFDVIKNAVAMYMIELLQHCLKQPEPNPELFHLIEDTLQHLDKASNTRTANLPLYFILRLAGELGFRMQGICNEQTPYIDLQEGMFMAVKPVHPYYLEGVDAQTTSRFLSVQFYDDLDTIPLNRVMRRYLLQAYQTYLSLHIADFGEMKSLTVLQEILS